MNEINADEIARELKEAIKNNDVDKVIKLNGEISGKKGAEKVEYLLDDASYGLYRFIVDQAKKYKIGKEDEEKEENTPRKENKSNEDEIKEERQ